ncbi:MAG: DUF421 domain-containing protein [Cyanophyceae cyanobacterium]
MQIGAGIDWLLGLNAETLTFWQMGARAATIYLFGLFIVRTGGDRRFTGKHAAFDVILGVILGSTLSRGINGSAPFFKTLVAGAVLVSIHWLVAFLACQFESFGTLIKGRSRVLIQDGQVQTKVLHKYHISQKDLESTLRQNAQLRNPSQVEVAVQESSGSISILPKQPSSQILEIDVADGVQKVQIQLHQ